MALPDHLTLKSMIGIAAAEAMKGEDARIADLSAAAEEFGIGPSAGRTEVEGRPPVGRSVEPFRCSRRLSACSAGQTRVGRELSVRLLIGFVVGGAGSSRWAFADHLTSMSSVVAAEAMKGGDARIADPSAPAEELGIVPQRTVQ
jgi:hypothetical protein